MKSEVGTPVAEHLVRESAVAVPYVLRLGALHARNPYGFVARNTRSRAKSRALSPRVAAADEVDPYVVERSEKRAHRVRREHAQVRRVVLWRATAQEPQPALDAERVRHRADERHPMAQHAPDLGDERVRELEVLEELACDDGVEAGVLERKGILDVRLHRLDPERCGLLERGGVDVEPDDRVSLEEVLVSAPERQPRSSTRFPRPIAATNSGMRSGTKTKSPSSRRSRWCSS